MSVRKKIIKKRAMGSIRNRVNGRVAKAKANSQKALFSLNFSRVSLSISVV